MRSAIDTNVVSALWTGQPAAQQAEELLVRAREEGGLVICGPVYAELLACPDMTIETLDDFLAQTGISIETDMPREVWQQAGLRFARYARRRRKSKAGAPRRVLAGFVIGSHALLRADRLLTFNDSDYGAEFPDLMVTGLRH